MPITNTAWVRFRFCKLQYKKGCTRLATASDKAYQLFAHGQWFSPGSPASSTTKTGHHDIAEILLKVALKHQKSKSFIVFISVLLLGDHIIKAWDHSNCFNLLHICMPVLSQDLVFNAMCHGLACV
jgi:hypothetical protein